MKWSRGWRSHNVEDRRGMSARPPSIGIRPRFGRSRLGLGGTIAVLLVIVAVRYLSDGSSAPPHRAPAPAATRAGPDRDQELVEFVSFVLDDAQAAWKQELARNGKRYTDARLVLFDDAVRSACGHASAAVGPFYCPADRKVYIDLAFYRALRDRLGAPGDFAQAYVIAHEIGHHVQNLLGTSGEVRAARGSDRSRKNELSVRLELQADCYAGVWAHSTARRDLLEQGDLEEGLRAASAVGDDTLQRRAKGRVMPETFTHGTSAQRARWFKKGYQAGARSACDTFTTSDL